MMVDGKYTWMDSPNLPPGPHGLYVALTIVDSKGNPWAPDFRGSGIIGIDAVTKTLKYWPVPTPNSSPRRSRMDAQDRIWFAEYTGDKIGMFDTRTETFAEWSPPTPGAWPYACCPTGSGAAASTTIASCGSIRGARSRRYSDTDGFD
jgi:streptogramin lyase